MLLPILENDLADVGFFHKKRHFQFIAELLQGGNIRTKAEVDITCGQRIFVFGNAQKILHDFQQGQAVLAAREAHHDAVSVVYQAVINHRLAEALHNLFLNRCHVAPHSQKIHILKCLHTNNRCF